MRSDDGGSQHSLDESQTASPLTSITNADPARPSLGPLNINIGEPDSHGERLFSTPTMTENTPVSARTLSLGDQRPTPTTSTNSVNRPSPEQAFPSSVVNQDTKEIELEYLSPSTETSNVTDHVRIDMPPPAPVVHVPHGKDKTQDKKATKVPSITHNIPCFNKKPMNKQVKRDRLRRYIKNELHPKRINFVGYCCPDESVKSRALPSEIREVKAEVIEKRRISRLKKAISLHKAGKVKKMEMKLLAYREQVQRRVDKMNNKRASGQAISEKKLKKEVKKLRFLDAQMYTLSKHAHRYAQLGVATGLSVRRKIWNFLRGKEEYPPSAVKWKDLAREQRDDVKSFILDIGYALSLYNVPAYRLEYSLQLLAAYYGIDIELQSTPTQLLVSFHDHAVDVDGNVEQPKQLTKSFSTDSLAELENQMDALSDISDDTTQIEAFDAVMEQHLVDPDVTEIHDPNLDMPEIVRRFHTNDSASIQRDSSNMPSSRGYAEDDSDRPAVMPRNDVSTDTSNALSDPTGSPLRNGDGELVSSFSTATEVNRNRESPQQLSSGNNNVERRERLSPSEAAMYRSSEHSGPDAHTQTQHDALFRTQPKEMLVQRSSDLDFLMHNSTHFVKVPNQSTDLTKLVQLEDLTDNIHRGRLSIKDARKRVKRIIETQPRNWWYILPLLATLLSSGAFAILLNANWKEIVAIMTSAFFIVVLEFLQRKVKAISTVFVTLAALVAGLVATGYKALFLSVDEGGPPLNIFLVALAATVGFFPGLSITVAVNELAEWRYLSGLIRLTASALQVLKIGFGILLANALALLIFPDDLAPPTDYTNPWWSYILAVFFAVISYCISFRVPVYPLAIMFIYTGAYSAFASSVYISRWIGTEFGTLLGALAVGFCGEVYSRLTTHPSLVVTSPAILLIVPGSLGVRAILQFSQRDIVGAVEFLFQIFLVAIALVVGLAFSHGCLPKRKTSTV
mmetsp:Transcript_1194/g.4114  ORF Transcript_1194/g.4114 Transcript_1194/m.4114 type:complete len:964 (-) Transcript_1194:178-3069(-)|eukprot:CAMPEP_0117435794 /NCGR_PEP_ID=MMETSP0759-20121206/668_1 /TAXON_ID=63605 /ORGANISM="Percolomonas cosmopolitus, Strain WS" /LENGTH=963 /DNA_ID=CAMNT_0005227359 /DNA_START=273 /DNA_END=3164 /DNA_ORIENTATION=+